MCIIAAEVVRKRIPGLYLINKIAKTEINELYKPLEKGLDEVKVTNTLAMIEIEVCRNPTNE